MWSMIQDPFPKAKPRIGREFDLARKNADHGLFVSRIILEVGSRVKIIFVKKAPNAQAEVVGKDTKSDEDRRCSKHTIATEVSPYPSAMDSIRYQRCGRKSVHSGVS